MNYNKLLFPLFIVVALVQLFVPAKMIINRETILAKGKEFRFKTAPIDPTDPFRGKYITLNFAERSTKVDSTKEWKRDDKIYVLLGEDSDGFVKIKGAMHDKPPGKDFVKAKVRRSHSYNNSIEIEYPFKRYYMEESKAYDAERYTRRRRFDLDSTQNVYAIVRVIDGEAVLQNVMINDQKIEDFVKEKQAEESVE